MGEEPTPEKLSTPERVFVVSGPSGAGKSTVVNELCDRGLAVRAVTATTRPPRENEQDGVDYCFLSPKKFKQWVREGRLLEQARYCGYCYGTPVNSVNAALARGLPVVLVIDVQGAMQVKETWPRVTLVFVAPPSEEELKVRLRGRAEDAPQEMAERVRRARKEMAYADRYDHVVVNDKLERAVEEIADILRSCRFHAG